MATKKLSFLLVEIEKQLFTLNVKSVTKIQEIEKITPIPSAPAHLHGLIELGDISLPLINLKHIFQFTNTKKDLEIAVISSFNFKNSILEFAFAVDDVIDIFQVDENDIKDVPKLHYDINLDYLSGLIKIDKNLAYVLRIEKILGLAEQEQLAEIVKNK